MSAYEVPEPWASAMIEAGFTDPRNDQRPSWRRLAEATDIHVSTLTAMAEGRRDTRQDVIDKVSENLRVPARVVNEWVGRTRTVGQPYKPPAVSSLLDRDERAAVDRLIVLLARSKKADGSRGEAGAGREGSPASPDVRMAPWS